MARMPPDAMRISVRLRDEYRVAGALDLGSVPTENETMTLSANTVLGLIIIAAILVAYVIARRMNQRQHDRKI